MNYLHGRMLVEATEDRCGNITIDIVASYWRYRFWHAVEVLESMGYAPVGHCQIDTFFNQGNETTELLEHHIPKRYHTDLTHGWTVRFLIEPWVYAHFIGYDCHNFI